SSSRHVIRTEMISFATRTKSPSKEPSARLQRDAISRMCLTFSAAKLEFTPLPESPPTADKSAIPNSSPPAPSHPHPPKLLPRAAPHHTSPATAPQSDEKSR